MDKKLAVIAVTFNNYEVLEDFLTSLQKQTDQDFHIYLTDNSTSKKEASPTLSNLTITEADNRGFAAGVNLSLQKALKDGFTNFVVINDDTFFKNDFIAKAKSSLNTFPGAIIGGKIYYAPDHEYHRERYQQNDVGKVLWYAGGTIDWSHMLAKHRGVDEVDENQYDNHQETEFITGCLILFDKSVLNTVGFLDERYFLYYEDVDFCIRARKKGVKLYYDSSLVIWHKVSQSTGGSGSQLHKKYQERNRLRIGLKYAPFRTKLHLLKNYLI